MFTVSDSSSECATNLETSSESESDHDNASALVSTSHIPSTLRDLGTVLPLKDRWHGVGHAYIEELPTPDEVASTPTTTNASVMAVEHRPTNSVRIEEEYVEEVSLQFASDTLALKVNHNVLT